MNRLDQWLDRQGIARVNNSVCGNNRPDVRINVQGRRWTPPWLAIRAGHRYFLRAHSLAASSLYLAHVEAIRLAADGSRRWTLHYRPTRTT